MKIFITGIAGVLGSSLARELASKGFEVFGNDTVRIDEAWRIKDLPVKYYWIATNDLKEDHLKDVDIVFDCGLGVPDRPFGNSSPEYTVLNNILPPLKLLETVRRLPNKPIMIYASSFNSVYGTEETITEKTKPSASSIYGWTKGCVEELYMTYYRMYNVPVIVTRVGSAYGPGMRSDELIARLILHALLNKQFILRSPEAKRLWTFKGDVIRFYNSLIQNIDRCIGEILICAGNRGDRITTNKEIAQIVKDLTNTEFEIIEGQYEVGETVHGRPIDFTFDSSYSRNKLNWTPVFSLEEGIFITIEWFKDNLWRYK